MDKRELEKIGTLDVIHLWMMFDGNTTRLQMVAEMADPVDELILKQAVKSNLKVFTNFRKKIVIYDNNFWFADNQNEVPVFRNDGKVRALCSEDTNRYPFYISFDEMNITFTFTHVVADGTGMYLFYDSVIKTYLRDRYPGEFEFNETSLTESTPFRDIAEPLELYEEKKQTNITGGTIPNQKSFNFRDCTSEEADVRALIRMPEDKVIELTKSWGVKPAAFIMTVFNTAVRNTYGLKDTGLIGGIMTDLRRRTGVYPLRNFSGIMFIETNPDNLKADFTEECKAVEEKIEKALEESDFSLNSSKGVAELFTKVPGSVQTKIATVKKMIGDAGKSVASYQMSYMRMGEHDEWYRSRVKGMKFTMFPSASGTPLIEAFSQDGIMTWEIIFLPDRETITAEISRLLAELGIECQVSKRTDSCKDYLDLERIEVIPE